MSKNKLSESIVSMESFLMEYSCTNCMESVYKPFMLVSHHPDEYPDIDFLESQIQEKSGRQPEHHVEKVSGSGWFLCGTYVPCRIWRLWENPDRYQEVASQTARLSNNPEVQKLHEKIKEKSHE